MNPPEGALAAPRLPRDADGPVFAEPWQAQAFALAVELNAQGLFSWSEWAQALSRRLNAADASDYYVHWLGALEELLADKGVAGRTAVEAMTAAWQRAAHATPHGQPIVLDNDPEG